MSGATGLPLFTSVGAMTSGESWWFTVFKTKVGQGGERAGI